MKTPRGWLLGYALLGFAVGIALAYQAIRDQTVVVAIASAGFLVLSVLLWCRSRWALVANFVLGLFVLGLGVSIYWRTGNAGMILGGLFILASYWSYHGELAAQADGRKTDGHSPTHGPGLCLALLREGWKPYRFPDSNVVVVLPHDFAAGFDREGVLLGTIDGDSHNFSATLHSDEAFDAEPASAYAFLGHLAQKAAVEPIDKGTYRYYKDPNTRGDDALEYTFYVIAIPGSVVVVSIASAPGQQRPDSLKRIESAIPDIIGELV